MVDIDVVERLLGVPPTYQPWRAATMAAQERILATWLSLAQANGLELSGRSADYLARARRRANELHRIGMEQSDAHGVTVIKGRRIASHMPPAMLRQSGDVDLVAPDEESLWLCVQDLAARYGATAQVVSVLEYAGGYHLCVAMKWPAEEPYLDKPMGADISTCAFAGDLKGVPCRAIPPEEDDLCGIFAVAEERFQRKFRIKDMLDFLVLAELAEARLGDSLTDVVCDTADGLALAPELRSLVKKVCRRTTVSDRWMRTLTKLDVLSDVEKNRRRPDRPGVLRLRFGFPLDTVSNGESGIRIFRREAGDIATTPIGSCLLTDNPVLDEDRVVTSMDYAERLYATEGR